MSGTIAFSQDLVTNQADLFTVINYNVRYLEPDDYQLTVSGDVDSEKSFSLADLQGMEQITRRATKMCGTNPSTGTMIYNVEYTGVDLISFLEAAGMKEGVNALVAMSYDGWGFPMELDLLREAGAFLGLTINGEALDPTLGYPVTLGVPGQGGFVWVKYLKSIELQTVPEDEIPEPLPIMFPVNAGFLKPPLDGTEVTSPVTIEGWAFGSNLKPVSKLLLSANYGKSWQEYPVPEGMDPAQWVYWSIQWEPPEPGHYLLKVKSQVGDVVQDIEDNLVLIVTG